MVSFLPLKINQSQFLLCLLCDRLSFLLSICWLLLVITCLVPAFLHFLFGLVPWFTLGRSLAVGSTSLESSPMNALHASSLLPCFSCPSPWTASLGPLGLLRGATTDLTKVATTTTSGYRGGPGGGVAYVPPAATPIASLLNDNLTSSL